MGSNYLLFFFLSLEFFPVSKADIYPEYTYLSPLLLEKTPESWDLLVKCERWETYPSSYNVKYSFLKNFLLLEIRLLPEE